MTHCAYEERYPGKDTVPQRAIAFYCNCVDQNLGIGFITNIMWLWKGKMIHNCSNHNMDVLPKNRKLCTKHQYMYTGVMLWLWRGDCASAGIWKKIPLWWLRLCGSIVNMMHNFWYQNCEIKLENVQGWFISMNHWVWLEWRWIYKKGRAMFSDVKRIWKIVCCNELKESLGVHWH